MHTDRMQLWSKPAADEPVLRFDTGNCFPLTLPVLSPVSQALLYQLFQPYLPFPALCFHFLLFLLPAESFPALRKHPAVSAAPARKHHSPAHPAPHLHSASQAVQYLPVYPVTALMLLPLQSLLRRYLPRILSMPGQGNLLKSSID